MKRRHRKKIVVELLKNHTNFLVTPDEKVRMHVMDNLVKLGYLKVVYNRYDGAKSFDLTPSGIEGILSKDD